MHIILGGNGHIGSALAQILLERSEPVTVVLHDSEKASDWEAKGAQVAVIDVHDVESLRQVFRQGQRLFLLNPPAPPSTDTATEERTTWKSILEALDDSGLEKVVAQSTYGAQPGERIGDLGVLYDMEQALKTQPIPTSIIRGAYYMSNWDAALKTAQQEGTISTFYPVDFTLPMVAPHDISQLAAKLLAEPPENFGIHPIEGPESYSSVDVAAAFSSALQKPVAAVETPRDEWKQALKKMGFSDAAAVSFSAMLALTLKEGPETPDAPTRGATSLQSYINDLVKQQSEDDS